MRCSIPYFIILLFTRELQGLLNVTTISTIFAAYEGKKLYLAPRKKGDVLIVELALVIQNMVPLKFRNNNIFMESDILLRWLDPRLKFKSKAADEHITLNSEKDIFFWRPDIMINNEQGIKDDQFPEQLSTAWIYPNGTVLYSSRVSVVVACPMKLDNFPFDKQSCVLKFESYAYNEKKVQFEFLRVFEEPVTLGDAFLISNFILENYTMEKVKENYGISGWFDQVEVTLHLKRDIRYYTMEYYLPVIGMVMISFVSFWIHFQATPARVALPTTTLLTMNKMIHHIRSSSLLYGNAEALEIFLNTSMVFVTAVLLEYGIVGLTNKRWSQRRKDKKMDSSLRTDPSESKIFTAIKGNSHCGWMKTIEEKMMLKHLEVEYEGHVLDQISKYLFPLLYMIFVTLYYVIYTHS